MDLDVKKKSDIFYGVEIYGFVQLGADYQATFLFPFICP